jgi:hypothetical protein
MSTAQRNDACLMSIGLEQADVLRHQTPASERSSSSEVLYLTN